MSVSRVSICFLMQNLKVGGAEKVGVTIIKHLDRRKFFPSLLVLGDDKGQLRRSLPQCLNVIYLSKRRAIFSLPRLIENIWSQKPDILFVNLSHLNLLLAMFRWLLPRNTLVIARETSIVSLNNVDYRFSFFWNLLYRIFYRHLDHIICQSAHMRQNLIEEFGVPLKKTTIIRNPTDIKRLRYLAGKATKPEFDERKITFVSVGALEIRKNFDGLIRAISLCRINQICLKIIGEGSERNKLEKLIDQLGLSSRVTLLGHVDNPCPLIFESDALVLTSIHEGLPNVILEALALKTSVIATPAGGVCEELLADRYGCFVAKDHSDTSIVDAIVDWSKNAPYQIDDNAVLSFDAQHVVQTFENLFKSVRR